VQMWGRAARSEAKRGSELEVVRVRDGARLGNRFWEGFSRSVRLPKKPRKIQRKTVQYLPISRTVRAAGIVPARGLDLSLRGNFCRVIVANDVANDQKLGTQCGSAVPGDCARS
jgi:hypothetical protein